MRRFIPIIIIIAIILCVVMFFTTPGRATLLYGPPSSSLTFAQAYQYSAALLWHDGLLTEPLDPNGVEQSFVIEQGESVFSIALRLEENKIIRDASAFQDYVIYTGLDRTIQAGTYRISAAMSIVDIARALQNAAAAEVEFNILPGWRMEEIAASLPTSGLAAAPDEFISLTLDAALNNIPDSLSNEGMFYPDSYILPRETNARELIQIFLRNFDQHLTTDLREGFNRQGLTVYQAIILASIVEREMIKDEEAPLIASVYLNRLNISMKLDADPTVQYAAGMPGAWWPSPIPQEYFSIDSLFNTYQYIGLPPAPISNPSLNSLRAVALPEATSFYYFRARCDKSGYHIFAATYEEHLANGCQ